MKLLTFLGPSDYSEVIYFYRGKEVKTKYIQKALSEIFKPEEVVIFVTEEAYKKHRESIRRKLRDVTFVPIETPKDQDDLWKLFKKIVETVPENDKVIFDITHSFRHIPFMSFLILLYLQEVKNVKIKGIYYGAFEAGITGKVPIFDLSSLLDLAEWLYRIRDLKEYGRGEGLAELIRKMNARFYTENAFRKPKSLAGYATLIDLLSKSLQLNQIPTFMELSSKAKESYGRFKDEVIEFLPPAKYTLSEIERLASFGCDEFGKECLERQIEIIEYLLEKEMTANALELMREWIVNVVIFLAGEGEWLEREVRIEAERALEWFAPSSKAKELKETKHLPLVKDKTVMKRLGKLWNEVRDLRNAIAHAGMKKDRPNVRKVQRKALEFLKEIKETMEELE